MPTILEVIAGRISSTTVARAIQMADSFLTIRRTDVPRPVRAGWLQFRVELMKWHDELQLEERRSAK